MAGDSASKMPRLDFPADVIDTHIHLSRHYSGGFKNEWHPAEAESFRHDWTEEDYLSSVSKGSCKVQSAIFVECFNRPPVEEAKWVQKMIDDPNSVIVAMSAQIYVQKGAVAVTDFLDQLRGADGALPKGLKGARMVFPAAENRAPDCCIEPKFLEGLAELGKHGLLWEFCVHPYMAPCIPECVSKFPDMTFIIDHLAHNGNEGGEMETWGPAIDAIGKCPNVYCKMGASEEWGVANKGEYMDRAIAAFGFDRILYESNWFVNEAMGDSYDTAAKLLLEACARAGATAADLAKIFRGNAIKAYRLDI
jgi:L-fuconolactonase